MKIEELENIGIEVSEDMKEGFVIIDIFTDWCAPCKVLGRILHKLEKDNICKIIKVDLEKTKIDNLFNITSVPTMIIFKDGILVNKNIIILGKTFLKKGMMVGAYGEQDIMFILDRISKMRCYNGSV